MLLLMMGTGAARLGVCGVTSKGAPDFIVNREALEVGRQDLGSMLYYFTVVFMSVQ